MRIEPIFFVIRNNFFLTLKICDIYSFSTILFATFPSPPGTERFFLIFFTFRVKIDVKNLGALNQLMISRKKKTSNHTHFNECIIGDHVISIVPDTCEIKCAILKAKATKKYETNIKIYTKKYSHRFHIPRIK